MSEINATSAGAAGADISSRYYVREHHPENGTMLGFWIYLMSDCLIFACLFATYAVLGRNYAGGPSGAEIFELPTVALNTAFLLISSITYGFAMLAAQKKSVGGTQIWLAITGIFGLCFLGLELTEFHHLIMEGNGPWRSGFLTAFFSLVGTHGLHVTFGIVWLVTMMFQVGKHGITGANYRRLSCLSLFWHFLDVVWIGVFTYVYLIGVLP
ncbi:MAG TPA: cytochrome o ubiquinol oxidase subunit III [Telluria sp.]|jgi:cytochrome o ubiquinol oxidase subunit 3